MSDSAITVYRKATGYPVGMLCGRYLVYDGAAISRRFFWDAERMARHLEIRGLTTVKPTTGRAAPTPSRFAHLESAS